MAAKQQDLRLDPAPQDRVPGNFKTGSAELALKFLLNVKQFTFNSIPPHIKIKTIAGVVQW